MGVALGAQYFPVDGGTGGSLSSVFSSQRRQPAMTLALQGAFGLPESPLHAPPLPRHLSCPKPERPNDAATPPPHRSGSGGLLSGA